MLEIIVAQIFPKLVQKVATTQVNFTSNALTNSTKSNLICGILFQR